MKKIIITIILALIALATPLKANASEISHASAQLAINMPIKTDAALDMRITALKNVLKRHNSPLVSYAAAYVAFADKNGIDWKLLPAISGLESSWGIYLNSGSYNAYGWGGGNIYFNSWEDGIATIDQALAQNYYAKGARDVWSIGPIYAESPTWSVRVNRNLEEINDEYQKISTFAAAPSI